MLRARLEAGRLLERGVLADMKNEPAAPILKGALEKLRESRAAMDTLDVKLDELRGIEKSNELLPEYIAALANLTKDHPGLERVSIGNVRFANIARAKHPVEYKGPIGKNLDEILGNIQHDLHLLKPQMDETIDAFRAAMPVAEKGGFAALVLSGRAPLPEKVLHSTDQMMVFSQFYNRACMVTIAADMQVYPKGLEWLKKPSKDWSGQ
jgi:hypothetical protein